MAMSKLSNTITFMTLYEPNIRRPQNRVYVLMPSSSKFSNPTIPKLAQNNDCDDSNKLEMQKKTHQCSVGALIDQLCEPNGLAESSPFHARITHIFPVSFTAWFVVAFLFLQIGKIPQ